MVSIEELQAGDVVKIVDEWDPAGLCRENNEGFMDKWLGQLMTVRCIAEDDASCVKMEEDHGEWVDGEGWWWNSHCIDYVVSEPVDITIDPADLDSFLSDIV